MKEDTEVYAIAEMIYNDLPEIVPYISKINEDLGIKEIRVNRIAYREELISNSVLNYSLNIPVLSVHVEPNTFSISIIWDYDKMNESRNAFVRNIYSEYTKRQIRTKDLSKPFIDLKRYIENILLFLANNDKIKTTVTSTKKILSIDTVILINNESIQAIAEALSMKAVECNCSYVDLRKYFSSMGFTIKILSVQEAFRIPYDVYALEVTD